MELVLRRTCFEGLMIGSSRKLLILDLEVIGRHCQSKTRRKLSID